MKRICGKCKKNKPSLSVFKDYRGNGVCLACEDCWPSLTKMLHQVPGSPTRDENGIPLHSPSGTPNINSLKELESYAK